MILFFSFSFFSNSNIESSQKKKDRYFACCSGKQVYIFNEDGKVLEIIEDGDDVRIFLFIFSFFFGKKKIIDVIIQFIFFLLLQRR